MAVFPDLIRDLTETGRHLDVPDATKWLNKVPKLQKLTHLNKK